MRFRTDIQALRGIAVLLVVLQHARHGLVDAGYLGVDIFFVVSGYLITGLIGRAIDAGNFSFREFYFRRAKRLLPAAYVTFALTMLVATQLLDAAEWRDFTYQLVGAVTFTANFVLWGQTGYFEGAAALKPLLHVWSLSIEEQYYLLVPAGMVLLPRRCWLAAAIMVLVSSLALYCWLAPAHPSLAFYLLPTRAWELALGSVAALVAFRGRVQKVLVLISPLALLALLVLPGWSLGLSPLVKLPLVCLATFVLISRTREYDTRSPAVTGLAWIGDFSYSLYLVHWPIFAFMNNVVAGDPTSGPPSDLVLAAAVAVAILLGYVLYRYVERPFHYATLRPSRRLLLATLATSLLLIVLPLVITAHMASSQVQGTLDFAELRRDNLGFGPECEISDRYTPKAACETGPQPDMLVWGDSFAMHLIPGIVATREVGIAQATKSACGPLLGLAQITAEYPRDYAEHCLAFNESVVEYLAATPSLHVVVLSSPFYPYFDPDRRLLQRIGDNMIERKPGEAVAIEAMRATVQRLRDMGKRVVLVAPPPSSGFDFTHCLERKATQSHLAGRLADCNIPITDYHASKARTLAFLERVQHQADVAVVRFDQLLCSDRECATAMDGVVLYRDEGHFSRAGSRLVARKMHLGGLLLRRAR